MTNITQQDPVSSLTQGNHVKTTDNYPAVDVTDFTQALTGSLNRYTISQLNDEIISNVTSNRLSVRTATTGSLATNYNNGNGGVGATLTFTSPGIVSIGGVTLNLNDRVLVKDQASNVQNGIYFLSTVGTALIAGVLTRSSDFDNHSANSNVQEGAFVLVMEGANAGQFYYESSSGPFTIGTSPITFSAQTVSVNEPTPLSPAFGGTGVNNNANTITVNGNVNTANSFTTSGNFPLTLTTTGITNVTLPTSGTLVNSSVAALTSLASVGTITSGIWQGTIVSPTYGGTGINNGNNTLTLASNFATSGAFPITLTATGATTVTLPTSGTLLTTPGSTGITTLGTITTGTWNGTIISPTYGGTGVNNGSQTLTLSGGNNINFNTTGATSLNLPTSGTVATLTSFSNTNYLIGADFDSNPWQRGTSFTGVAATQYTADRYRWFVNNSTGGVVTVAQVSDPPNIGIPSDLVYKVTVTTAVAAPAANETYAVGYRVEGFDYTNLAQQVITLSFNVKATVTGTYCVTFTNSGQDRVYQATYTIGVSNTWQNVVLTIPASPSAGTWNYTNGVGLDIYWIVASGDQSGTGNAWSSTFHFAPTGIANNMATNGNVFEIDHPKLELGSFATLFEQRLQAQSLQICQRYYEKSYDYGVLPATNTANGSFNFSQSSDAAATFSYSVQFRSTKRTTPNITIYSVAGTTGKVTQDNGSEISASATSVGFNSWRVNGTNGPGRFGSAGHFTADAEL